MVGETTRKRSCYCFEIIDRFGFMSGMVISYLAKNVHNSTSAVAILDIVRDWIMDRILKYEILILSCNTNMKRNVTFVVDS